MTARIAGHLGASSERETVTKPAPFVWAKSVGNLLPGVLLCLAITAVAQTLQWGEEHLTGHPYVEALVLAILLGTALRTIWVPARPVSSRYRLLRQAGSGSRRHPARRLRQPRRHPCLWPRPPRRHRRRRRADHSGKLHHLPSTRLARAHGPAHRLRQRHLRQLRHRGRRPGHRRRERGRGRSHRFHRRARRADGTRAAALRAAPELHRHPVRRSRRIDRLRRTAGPRRHPAGERAGDAGRHASQAGTGADAGARRAGALADCPAAAGGGGRAARRAHASSASSNWCHGSSWASWRSLPFAPWASCQMPGWRRCRAWRGS